MTFCLPTNFNACHRVHCQVSATQEDCRSIDRQAGASSHSCFLQGLSCMFLLQGPALL